MQPLNIPHDVSGWTIAGAAVIAALAYLLKMARRAFVAIDALNRLVSDELNHNGGHSMKDRATQAAETAARVETTVDIFAQELRDHIADADRHMQLHADGDAHPPGSAKE